MSKSILDIIYNIQSLCIFLSFIVSLRLVKNDKIPDYMKGFFWYPTIGTIVMGFGFVGNNFFINLEIFGKIINNISLLFHFSFLSIFIIRTMRGTIHNRFLKLLFVVFFCLILFSLSIYNIKEMNKPGFAIANFGLSIFCVIYYYQLFNNIPTLHLRKEPSFWIITGIFFCMSLHVPIFAIINYLHFKILSSSYR